MEGEDEFFERAFFSLYRQRSSFCEDIWLRDTALSHRYPTFYRIVQRKRVSVAYMMSQVPLNRTFRRLL
jgi:hypothetical protein